IYKYAVFRLPTPKVDFVGTHGEAYFVCATPAKGTHSEADRRHKRSGVLRSTQSGARLCASQQSPNYNQKILN
ncbi:hypothetical protein, partial [Brachyspira hampsonii]|uniref:hypothetical protein n=1 Tax=Brachyspira hampsonii TaxID=1287055 RepID=UPI001C405688